MYRDFNNMLIYMLISVVIVFEKLIQKSVFSSQTVGIFEINEEYLFFIKILKVSKKP